VRAARVKTWIPYAEPQVINATARSQMSRTARAAKGFGASIIQFCAQTLVQVLLAPIVLRVAGRETLGAYAAIMQALGLLNLLDVAGSWSLERFLAQATGLDDGGARFRILLTTARTMYWVIYGVYAVLVLVFSFFIGPIFHLSPAVTGEARHALWVIAIWSVVRVPLVAYNNALIATQDIAAANMISAVGSVLRTLASLGYVLAGGGLFGLMLAGTTAEVVSLFLYRVRFRRIHGDLAPGWGIPDKSLLREMISFGSHAAILNVGNMLAFGTGNSVAGITNGAAAASSFYTSQMPSMMASNLLGRLSESAQPALNELFGRGDFERMRSSFSRLTRLQLLFGLPLGAGVLLFNRDLVAAWVGPTQYAGALLTAAIGTYCMIGGLQGIAIRLSYVFGWMRLLAVTSILQGLANFGLGLYLGRRLGLGGISLAMLIAVLPQIFILLRKIGNAFNLNITQLVASCALKAILPLTGASAAGLLVHRFVQIRVHHFGGFLLEVCPFIVVYSSVAYFVYLTDQDRDDVKRFLAGAIDRGRDVGVQFQRVLGIR